MRYRKKPVVIEAVEWNGRNLFEVRTFMGERVNFDGDWRVQDRFHELETHSRLYGLKIETLEGTMNADVGDYIIKGVHGEFYPCKPDIFEKTYEKAD